MAINNIYSKLRSKNIKNYYILIFCTILSVVLITSYAVMFFSPTVQKILPVQGDSRKQAYLIFGIAIIGCAVFTTYASSLFFKYKSKETGVLLSLGAKKSQIKKVLFTELSLITLLSSLIGLALSIPVSFGIWKLFQIFIIDTKEMTYHIGWYGIIFGIAFCLFVTLCIFIMGGKFIKRTNIIDIINEHRKYETVKDVKPWYGIVGGILIILGMFLGYGVPELVIKHLDYILPPIWNITFLLSAIGIYMLITYAVIHSKKGKSPKKYYKNIIPKSMMKFMGKQTVRSMCTITLLIAGGLFAAFYTPAAMAQFFYSVDNNPVDYSFHYKMTENQITKNEIYSLTEKYDVNITNYDEIKSILLIVDGTESDFEDDGRITYDYIDKIGYGKFFSESDFNRVSGQNVNLKPGEYLTIIGAENSESIHKKFDNLNKITSPVTDISGEIKYAGTITFEPFAHRYYMNRYVISNEDYKRHTENLPLGNFENFVLFNVENPDGTYEFANELKNEIIKKSSNDVAVIPSYDEYTKKLSVEKGEEYWADKYIVELSPDNNQLFTDWKYYPSFGILDRQDLIKNMSIFLMLFIYIAIVCFTAVGIISYTRSLTIAINNKTLFDDLKRLGANNSYIEKCIKVQLEKIFTIPTIVGSTTIYLFYFLIMYGNSGSITESEYIVLGISFGIILAAELFMYLIYRLSLTKVKRIVEI